MTHHDHRFEEPSNVEVDETLVIYQDCLHREIRGSQYSERWDEVFYDEGPKCEATKITYYDFDGVYYDLANDGGKGLEELDWDENEVLCEDLYMRAEREIEEATERYPDPVEFDPIQDEFLWCMNHEGDEYVVRWERTSQAVVW